MGVTQLGYFGLSVVDLPAWTGLLTELGCQVRADSPAGTAFVRVDERHHRIELAAGTTDDLAYLGFEARDPSALAEIVQHLRDSGIAVARADEEDRARRRVMDLYVLTDPSGYRVELYYGSTVDADAFVSPAGLHSFVTGTQGVGHVVIMTPLFEQTVGFYTDGLGFRVSDIIQVGSLDATFLHCNERHHTLAVLRAPVAAEKSEFHHFMLEVADLDAVGRALDRCTRAGFDVSYSLGRHTNDEMVSFYVRTPAGSNIEYGTGGRLIDDATWRIQRYESTSYWGHTFHPEST